MNRGKLPGKLTVEKPGQYDLNEVNKVNITSDDTWINRVPSDVMG